ncbi:MAG: redoxin domain-containing protein [Gammaproteobacteria bacterium]|nr:redoxin domain-containing protein [Gammaproteobacteria bacterium]
MALPGVANAEIHAFKSGGLQQILVARAGKPFILGYWSLTCVYCAQEMKTLAALQKRYPKLEVVLVYTDTPEEKTELEKFVAKQGLAKVDQWVFAESPPEKLRYEIDCRWWGELPRTYFYDAGHRPEAVSGLIPSARLESWIRAQVP